ncbi:hypothetical protein K504DRAFT_535058 [Pleomassaria siparia CBS 279.74]|uniref:NAD(P)-binding protein n=1 Tax=Pleomassaria siparia CBS 279.74 TaxID=1314801 RepID=A0A6G1K764_9PLEO|nr:hypothetical protein K504DRAFT_535058 [Pleomassaria siparia CBS 279.74]
MAATTTTTTTTTTTPAAKTIILITGANSGVGFALASRLLAKGTYHVLVGSRSVTKGTAALTTLLQQSPSHEHAGGTAELLHLDGHYT